MHKYFYLLFALVLPISFLTAQSLGDVFKMDTYPYHVGVDSIVSTKYMINEYADNEADMEYTLDDKKIPLHYFERTILVYPNNMTSVSKTTHRFMGEKETLELKFNKEGKAIYMKTENPSTEMMNEEKVYKYDDQGRLIMQLRTGYNLMEYEQGNKEIKTDTVVQLAYGENNLISSGTFNMDAGLLMKVNTEQVGDTIRYFGEMVVSGPMAEMMGGQSEKGKLMDVTYNKETGNYEAIEIKRGGAISKEIIDKSGATIEKIMSMNDKVISHEKYKYKNGVMSGTEVLIGEDPEVTFNDAGQKITEQASFSLIHFKYDDKGNLIEEIKMDPYSLEFEELTVYDIFYKQ